MAGLLLGLGACGSDDEKSETTATSPPATQEETVTEEQETETEAEPGVEPPATETEPGTAPVARGRAGRGGRRGAGAHPGAVHRRRGPDQAAPGARARLHLDSSGAALARDGNSYGLTFAGRTIEVSDGLGSVSTTFDGLRPGEVLVGQVMGAPGRVRIEATAEPGP